LHRLVLGHVTTLRSSKLVKAGIVLVQDLKAVTNFVGPEVKIRDVPCKLMRIQRDKPL
jgi:hypothetical protein